MNTTGQYHSALHDSDNVFHIDGDCVFGAQIKLSCRCAERRPEKMCDACELNHLRRLKA